MLNFNGNGRPVTHGKGGQVHAWLLPFDGSEIFDGRTDVDSDERDERGKWDWRRRERERRQGMSGC